MSEHAALDYLRAPRTAPWRWEEDGRVIAWHDGTTILFREELEALLARLAPGGLPPFFSALVVLLAAAKGKVPTSLDLTKSGDAGRGQMVLALHLRAEQQALAELSRVALLPRDLVANMQGKALLAEAVFEQAVRLSAAESEAVVRGLPEAWGEQALNDRPADAGKFDLGRMIQTVGIGLGRHTAESLLQRLRTGLDALPAEVPDLELPREERARRLLEALGSDEEMAGLAVVVRDLMAALRLPRTLTQPDETAAEGVADVGNRGPLDRLLLSELANDDLTLATRVALNEALYLRREPPAHRPERSLAVLLDSGLRMWGVPRVIGAAGALALLSRHPANCPALAWRAKGRALAPTDLLTKKGLEAHLAALETDLHAGAALPALGKALEEHPEVDVVVVTHRDALGDAAFQAQLAQAKFARGFLLLVERDGLVQLHPLPWGAPRPLVEVQVDVEKLFPRPKGQPGPAPLLLTAGDQDLPGIFRLPVFPLLLPVVGKMECSATVGDKGGGLCVMMDRRLLHWREHGLGARQLAAELPAGRTCWLGLDEKDRAVMVKGRGADGRMSVVIVDEKKPAPTIAAFAGPHAPVAVKLDREVVLVVLNTRIVAVGLGTGEVVAETPIPAGHRWINEGYFHSPDGPRCLTWGGTAAKWVPLDLLRTSGPPDILTFFDRGIANAWMVTRDGRVLTPLCVEHVNIGGPVVQVRILDNGNRLLARLANTKTWRAVDLRTKLMTELKENDPAITGEQVVPPTRNLQANFGAVWAKPGEPLRLMTKPGRWLELVLVRGGLRMQGSEVQKGLVQRSDAQTLAAMSTPARLGCRLSVAKWPAGNRAWVDSRGLLHLRNADPGVPEIALTPTVHGVMAGWSADGRRCGPAFFHGEGVKDETSALFKIVEQFCQNAC